MRRQTQEISAKGRHVNRDRPDSCNAVNMKRHLVRLGNSGYLLDRFYGAHLA
ncbi:hypothetical protein MBAV_000043 [Candidatus Magnetobacterium bavaricum]|uniref:Uncharacterized protein n=1 Tax=Candidatus Magnetobacterium bavaricum TaxID=29290 RepID=A0A0F3H0Y4_9BACT|nr:hypothetical protein MBAV_000043 [Candidatus Magnetobacterium bavaricum]